MDLNWLIFASLSIYKVLAGTINLNIVQTVDLIAQTASFRTVFLSAFTHVEVVILTLCFRVQIVMNAIPLVWNALVPIATNVPAVDLINILITECAVMIHVILVSAAK